MITAGKFLTGFGDKSILENFDSAMYKIKSILKHSDKNYAEKLQKSIEVYCFTQLGQCIAERGGILNASFPVHMPGNNINLYNAWPYDRLCSMSFPALDSDTEEWNELELEELVDEKLVSLDLKQIALNLMYAKYQIVGGKERAAALYQYLSWDMCKNIIRVNNGKLLYVPG